MGTTPDCELSSKRQPKHERIVGSIRNLEAAIESFRDFVNELEGSCSPDCEADKYPSPSFVNVITECPNQIAGLAEEIRSETTRLRALLIDN